mmetsp:Transcript_28535/g.60220  ORF Transcript_28535/g.60220 Transcript_28535/m.60220 type:complete len:457 (+) Transcript_28535:36-1406(+)
MGKKSKAKKNSAGKKKAATTAAPASTTGHTAAASCWICLEEGPNELGQPIARDCSCRGDSGFAHLNCLVQYAEQKPGYLQWETCPNCLQNYRNELRLDLANACMKITKDAPMDPMLGIFFEYNPVKYTAALYVRCNALAGMVGSNRPRYQDELRTTALEMISVIDKMKRHVYIESTPEKIVRYEALAHAHLGGVSAEKDEHADAIQHLKKSRDLFKSIGDKENFHDVDVRMKQEERFQNNTTKEAPRPNNGSSSVSCSAGNNAKETTTRLDILRNQYKEQRDFETGQTLLMALMGENRTIEMERLLRELIRDSRRVHGTNHDVTRGYELALEKIKVRCTMLNSRMGTDEKYKILRYSDDNGDGDGRKVVVQGPITSPTSNEGRILTVDTDDLLIKFGTPVICHSLKNSVHLNGKIGDVRDAKGDRYEVHFEDAALKPCLVRGRNMRVLFDLPPKDV